MNIFRVTVIRGGAAIPLDEVVELRSRYFYEDPLDPRYAVTGIHKKLSVDQLRVSHEADWGSRYVLAFNPTGQLAGYLRLSVIEPGEKSQHLGIRHAVEPFVDSNLAQYAFLMTWVVMVSPEYQGRPVSFGGGPPMKVAEALYDAALNHGAGNGARLALADIYVSPSRNERSLALHHRLGFVTTDLAQIVELRGGVEIVSERLLRPITR